MAKTTANKFPTISDLKKGISIHKDNFSLLLNSEPPIEWIKIHPKIKNHKYLPIDKIEYLLKNLFAETRIEILREGHTMNGVYVSVRLHYRKTKTGQWSYNDGIGAIQLEIENNKVKEGAITPAFPLAETLAVKNASEKFGKLFGSDLNRDLSITEKKDNIRKKNNHLALP
jgi:hypothetical protein